MPLLCGIQLLPLRRRPNCPSFPCQVSLLEQRSRSLQWGRGSSLNLLGNTTSSSSSANNAGTTCSSSNLTAQSEEVDNHINFNMGQPSGRSGSTDGQPILNPVLTPEYLEAHDAVLLCGPYKLNQFMADSGMGNAAGSSSTGWGSNGGAGLGGQTAVLTLSGHQLLQSTAKNFMVHVKYIPCGTQVVVRPFIHFIQRPFSSGAQQITFAFFFSAFVGSRNRSVC